MRFQSFLLVILLSISGAIAAQGKKQTIVFSNLDNKKGKLFIGWYNKSEDFRKSDKAVFRKTVEVGDQDAATVVFDHVPAGTYAVAVFFDTNGNGKMDTNMLGIPKEKYGFSNNVFPAMRAASFKEASFTVSDKEETISITLK